MPNKQTLIISLTARPPWFSLPPYTHAFLICEISLHSTTTSNTYVHSLLPYTSHNLQVCVPLQSAMVRQMWTLDKQCLLQGHYLPIRVIELDLSDLADNPVEELLDLSDESVGVACTQDEDGVTTQVAFATRLRNVLCIRLSSGRTVASGTETRQRVRSLRVLQRSLLHNDQRKLAFDMHSLALALFYDHELTISRAVDLQSSSLLDRRSVAVLVSLLGGESNVDKEAVVKLFKGDMFGSGSVESLVLRAWATRRVASLSDGKLQRISLIDTRLIPSEVRSIVTRHTQCVTTEIVQDLAWLAKFTRVAWCLHALKPTRTENDVATNFKQKNGSDKLQIEQTRFKTRLRKSHNQVHHCQHRIRS